MSATVAETQSDVLLRRLAQLGVSSRLIEQIDGPTLTTYVLEPVDNRIKMVDFKRLRREDDLAYALGVESVRILAPLPGRSAVGVEVPRVDRQNVTLADLPTGDLDETYPLRVPIGLQADGSPLWMPLGSAPHVLVAGATNSGKTCYLHALIGQLCRYNSPHELGLVLIDPKRTELTCWEGDKHLLADVAETPQEAVRQLGRLVEQMETRYKTFREMGVKDIHEANMHLAQLPGRPVACRIVCVTDEWAELKMTGKEAEGLLIRLAQKGRAAGIHLVVATQYPLANLLSGVLRVNLPSKVCFAVTDKTASRLVLDRNGGELLLGRGDGLLSVGGAAPYRFQSAMLSDDEVEQIKGLWNA